MSKADVVRLHLAPVLVPLILERRAKNADTAPVPTSRDGGPVTALPKDAA